MLLVTEAFAEPAISQTRALFREYSMTNGVEICLQDFEAELASLPGKYARPTGRLCSWRYATPCPSAASGCANSKMESVK